ATLKAVKEKEQLLRENYTNDCERLQKHLTELKKNALQNDTDFDEIRKVGELLTEAKKKKAQLREPLSETEIIAALGDISGLWEFMFPGARQELVHLLIGEIRVFAPLGCHKPFSTARATSSRVLSAVPAGSLCNAVTTASISESFFSALFTAHSGAGLGASSSQKAASSGTVKCAT
ncbi:MAG: hypothetical protein IJC27_08690, partial [Lentisphaeria bacterium]|nr:hypothetical protein [Lentisphaeria bacterium]